MTKPTVLVVFGSAKTGMATLSHLCSAFKDDVSVRAGFRKPEAAAPLLQNMSFEVVEMDAERPETLPPAFSGVDKAMIIAPNCANRVDIVRTLIDAAKAQGVKHIVLLSVPKAEEELIMFEKEFHAMEGHAEQSGMAWTHLRTVFFAENLFGFQGSIKEQGKIYFNLGLGTAPFVTIDDVGRTAATVLATPGHEGKIYTLTGPEDVTGEGVAQAFAKHLGKDVQYVDVPREAVEAHFERIGLAKWAGEGIAELVEKRFKTGTSLATADIEAITGNKATRLEDYIALVAPAFLS